MNALLAYADSGDQSLNTMKLVLTASVGLAAIAITAFIPAVIARRRQARHAGAILPVSILWAVLTAAAVIPFIAQRQKWSQDDQQMLMSGYYDPHEQAEKHPAPAPPLPFWMALACAYVAIMLWASLSVPTSPAPDHHKTNGDPAA